MKNKFAVFAVGKVGCQVIELFLDRKEQLEFVLLDEANFWNMNGDIIELLKQFPQTEILYYTDDESIVEKCRGVDAVILAFWSKVIKGDLLNAPKNGYLNLHTSYLPYGKGKHAHYWAIVEGTPFGVTLMKINAELDKGNIIYQKKIDIEWTDTGETLYFKAIKMVGEILRENKTEILELTFEEQEQQGEGTFHYGKEIDSNSRIILDGKYTARQLINLMRARTYAPFPAAYFEENGKTYEIRVAINELEVTEKKIDYMDLKKRFEK